MSHWPNQPNRFHQERTKHQSHRSSWSASCPCPCPWIFLSCRRICPCQNLACRLLWRNDLGILCTSGQSCHRWNMVHSQNHLCHRQLISPSGSHHRRICLLVILIALFLLQTRVRNILLLVVSSELPPWLLPMSYSPLLLWRMPPCIVVLQGLDCHQQSWFHLLVPAHATSLHPHMLMNASHCNRHPMNANMLVHYPSHMSLNRIHPTRHCRHRRLHLLPRLATRDVASVVHLCQIVPHLQHTETLVHVSRSWMM